jgi:hypothetical protein
MKQKHRPNQKEERQRREEALQKFQTTLKTETAKLEQKKSSSTLYPSTAALNIQHEIGPDIPPVRTIETFNRKLKTDDHGRIREAVALHLYGKYKVAPHLVSIWDRGVKAPSAGAYFNVGYNRWGQRVGGEAQPDIDFSGEELVLHKRWFAIAASGGSLFKQATKSFMTKMETHWFLTCPIKASFREAVIYAIARNYTDNIGILTRVMKSKLNTLKGVGWLGSFEHPSAWREVIHFYVKEELDIKTMNDLFDFFAVRIGRNADTIRMSTYSLKGRTKVSILKQMQDWHYELARVKRMGNRNWDGIPIANETFTYEKEEWSFTQLVTSKDLAAEGTAMHHCVYSYQQRCVQGLSSIWSVKKKNKHTGELQREITLEIDINGNIVQIRRFANRAPTFEDMKVIKYWASKNMLRISSYY